MEKSPVSFTLNVPAAITGGREAIGHKAVANSALDLIKKKLQDSGAPVTVSPTTGTATAVNGVAPVDVSNGKGLGVEGAKEKSHKGDHASSDESSESDEEDPEPTKEQKVNDFKVRIGLVMMIVPLILNVSCFVSFLIGRLLLVPVIDQKRSFSGCH